MTKRMAMAREILLGLPITRVASVLRYTDQLQTAGAPVGPILERSGIPSALLEHPEAAVPLPTAFHFGELACQALGTEHLGLYVGLAGSLDGLGRYGRTLKASLTLYEYLSKGISLYNMLTTDSASGCRSMEKIFVSILRLIVKPDSAPTSRTVKPWSSP